MAARPIRLQILIRPAAAAATTNDQGAFVFPATAPGEYEMQVTHSKYAARPPAQVEVPAGASDFDFGELTLVAGATIHGIVTGADGELVAGAVVKARGRGRSLRSAEREATTDADGRFRIAGLSSELADLACAPPATRCSFDRACAPTTMSRS